MHFRDLPLLFMQRGKVLQYGIGTAEFPGIMHEGGIFRVPRFDFYLLLPGSWRCRWVPQAKRSGKKKEANAEHKPL